MNDCHAGLESTITGTSNCNSRSQFMEHLYSGPPHFRLVLLDNQGGKLLGRLIGHLLARDNCLGKAVVPGKEVVEPGPVYWRTIHKEGARFTLGWTLYII